MFFGSYLSLGLVNAITGCFLWTGKQIKGGIIINKGVMKVSHKYFLKIVKKIGSEWEFVFSILVIKGKIH